MNLELLHDDRRVFGQTNLADEIRYEVDYFRIPDWEPNAILTELKPNMALLPTFLSTLRAGKNAAELRR